MHSSPSAPQNCASRRTFLQSLTLAGAAAGLARPAHAAAPTIPGLEKAPVDPEATRGWKPVSDRKLRVGIVGYGVCRFGAAFSFQDHPNVEVVAVSDLVPAQCAELARACRCSQTYPSLEELVKDDRIEAVFVATDAPSHARHCIEVLRHGKHVASAVPAMFGSLEEGDQLLAAVRSSGRKYMMFETSCYHADLHAMRVLHQSGGLGDIVYSEGEYYHYMEQPIPSFRDWRVGLPPQWYPTHSNAYHLGVTLGSFTEVSCLGMPSRIGHLQPANNRYQNPFGTEIALFRTREGGMSRMAVSWDTPGDEGERGRVRGRRGTFHNEYQGLEKQLPDTRRPPLPPKVEAGGHGGSHGYLMNEFVTAILEDRQPLVNIALALNLTAAGIVAHQSALKGGEWLRIPQYSL
jgi:predicted dehydrogenase